MSEVQAGEHPAEATAAEAAPPATAVITPPRVRADASVRTYRYLRLSLVGLVLLLLFCVWLERLTGDPVNRHLGSISAYYYTPARSVFVGALVAIGISLASIVGRRGFEDTALNIAGMLAPVVAMVPTPRGAGGAPCDPDGRCSVPPEFVPAVVNNVWGLVGLGLLGLALGAVTIARRPETSRGTKIGFLVAAGVWVAFLVWFRFGRESFLDSAHFGAAVPLFALISGVAYVNARRATSRRDGVPGREPSREAKSYRTVYGITAGVMVATFVVAVVLVVIDQFLGGSTPSEWVLWVEVVLLVAFAVFWVTQTLDYWHDGLPEDAAATATAVPAATAAPAPPPAPPMPPGSPAGSRAGS